MLSRDKLGIALIMKLSVVKSSIHDCSSAYCKLKLWLWLSLLLPLTTKTMNRFLRPRFLSSTYQQGEVGTRRPQDSRQWNDHDAKINDVRDGDEDYDDYDKEGNDKGNMDWDSIGDFSQYPKAAGSDVSRDILVKPCLHLGH